MVTCIVRRNILALNAVSKQIHKYFSQIQMKNSKIFLDPNWLSFESKC